MKLKNKAAKNNKAKIIFSDADGTLLNENSLVDEETINYINKLKNEGIIFVLASGRMPSGILDIYQHMNYKGPYISYNGALIFDDNDNIIYDSFIDKLVAMEIKNFITNNYADICCSLYSYDHWIVDDRTNPWIIKEETTIKIIAEDRFLLEKVNGIHKILINGSNHNLELIRTKILEEYPELTTVISIPNYLEITSDMANKSISLKRVCEHYDISLDEVIAIGDGYNDIGMLKTVSKSYAMKNAPNEVKKFANNITESDNNNQGILKVLKREFSYMI